MTVDLKFFIVGLLLLWFPRHWMRRGMALLRRRRRSAEASRITEPWKDREPGRPRINFVTEFLKFRNYLDLFRAAAGSVMLCGGLGMPAAIAVSADGSSGSGLLVMGVRWFVLLVALLSQAVRYDESRVSFYPPIFFIGGLSVGLCDGRSAALAFVLIWALIPLLGDAQLFLTVYAVVIVAFGHCFGEMGDLYAGYAGVLCFLPVLLSLLARKPLMIYARKGTRG